MPDSTAETVRRACLEAARAAYYEAGIAGLCEEGRWELALDAIRSLDLEAVLAEGGLRSRDAGNGPASAQPRSNEDE